MSLTDDLAAFSRVAELASFTQAAQDLGLPKASVSAAVQRLEAALGTRLLQRTTRRVQLTDDGRTCYERGQDLLADLEDLQALFRGDGAALRGRLRVDMPMGTGRSLVIPRLPEFLAAHPGLELELSTTDRRVDLLREGFDCVLRVGTLVDSSLVARPLGALRMVNCASPDYLRRHGTPLTPDDLAQHRLVHYVPVLGGRSPGFEIAEGAGAGATVRFVPMAGPVTVNNSEAYLAACLAGLGIVQIPESGARAALADGRLVEVLPDHRAAPMPVSLLVAHRRHLPRRVQAFMQWLTTLVTEELGSRDAGA
jgi:DNA-binding transcriptional LysR family regulator